MVVAIAMIPFLTWLNTRGIVTGKTVVNIFTSTKVIALFGFILIGFFATKGLNSLADQQGSFLGGRKDR